MESLSPKKICLVGSASSIHMKKWAGYFVAQNYEVHCITCGDATIRDVRMHKVGFGLGMPDYGLAIPRVAWLIRQIKPDLVHVHYIAGYGLMSLPALYSGIPVIATAWGSDVLVAPNENPFARRTINLLLRKAQHLIAVSRHLKDAMINLGAEAEKITVLPIGVDTNIFTPTEKIPHNDLRIITLNAHEPVYNTGHIILALKEVVKERKNVQATVVGTGSETDRLREMAVSLDLSRYITFTGRVPLDELLKLLKESDVYISAASSAGTPVSLLEAMACGVYPIITDIPGHRDWVDNGINGLLFSPGATDALTRAIISAATDSVDTKKTGAYSRNLVVQKADWVKCMSEAEQIYHRLCH
jgi:glycosyltransferase involved in cell wall biosynthesis